MSMHDDLFNDPDKLEQYITRTLVDVIFNIEEQTAKLKDISNGDLSNTHLVSTRIKLQEQKNELKMLNKVMKAAFKKNSAIN